MCKACWEDDYDEAREFTDFTDPTVKLIGKVFEANETGGQLHVVIDDWNLEDGTLRWVAENHLNDLSLDETRLLFLFEMMSEGERATALAIHEGYIQNDSYCS
jgi:hypothetical protein